MAEEIKEAVEETEEKKQKEKKPELIYPAKPESWLDFTYKYILAHAKDNREVADWLKEYYSSHEGTDIKLPKLRSEYAKEFWKDAFPKKPVVTKPSAKDEFWNQINNM